MSDKYEHHDHHDLFHSHYWHDWTNRNHITIQRLVPELLGELDNAQTLQEQMAYILAALRRLARDQAILKHEFDSVIDGLLSTINKILKEFSDEITEEINNIWNEINKLQNTDVGNHLSLSENRNTLTHTRKLLNGEVQTPDVIQVNIGTIENDIKNIKNDITNINNRIDALSKFIEQIYNNLVESGGYEGGQGDGSFKGHIATGNINFSTQSNGSTDYIIRTHKGIIKGDYTGAKVN